MAIGNYSTLGNNTYLYTSHVNSHISCLFCVFYQHLYIYTYIYTYVHMLPRSKCGTDKHLLSSKHEAGLVNSLACTLGRGDSEKYSEVKKYNPLKHSGEFEVYQVDVSQGGKAEGIGGRLYTSVSGSVSALSDDSSCQICQRSRCQSCHSGLRGGGATPWPSSVDCAALALPCCCCCCSCCSGRGRCR